MERWLHEEGVTVDDLRCSSPNDGVGFGASRFLKVGKPDGDGWRTIAVATDASMTDARWNVQGGAIPERVPCTAIGVNYMSPWMGCGTPRAACRQQTARALRCAIVSRDARTKADLYGCGASLAAGVGIERRAAQHDSASFSFGLKVVRPRSGSQGRPHATNVGNAAYI